MPLHIFFSKYYVTGIWINLLTLCRYCREENAKPLWALSAGCPSNADIPSCSYCRGPLCYEFQVGLFFFWGKFRHWNIVGIHLYPVAHCNTSNKFANPTPSCQISCPYIFAVWIIRWVHTVHIVRHQCINFRVKTQKLMAASSTAC